MDAGEFKGGQVAPKAGAKSPAYPLHEAIDKENLQIAVGIGDLTILHRGGTQIRTGGK